MDLENFEFSDDIAILASFMQGPEHSTFVKMIHFFSTPEKYLHPRELMRFVTSMTDEEWNDFKVDFWDYMVFEG